MKMVADDFWVVHQATQASPTAFALADAASYGYDLGAETLSGPTSSTTRATTPPETPWWPRRMPPWPMGMPRTSN